MKRRLFRAAISNRQANKNVVFRSFRVFGKNVEIPIVVKNAGVDQLELWCAQAVSTIFLNQPCVWIFAQRIFVEGFHVRMRRRRVDVVIKLLYILAVVALRARQSEEALLQDWIFRVPKRERETKSALPIGDTQQSVFTPAISATARVIVWKIIPAISIGRIIFTDCRPLPLGEVR